MVYECEPTIYKAPINISTAWIIIIHINCLEGLEIELNCSEGRWVWIELFEGLGDWIELFGGS